MRLIFLFCFIIVMLVPVNSHSESGNNIIYVTLTENCEDDIGDNLVDEIRKQLLSSKSIALVPEPESDTWSSMIFPSYSIHVKIDTKAAYVENERSDEGSSVFSIIWFIRYRPPDKDYETLMFVKNFVGNCSRQLVKDMAEITKNHTVIHAQFLQNSTMDLARTEMEDAVNAATEDS